MRKTIIESIIRNKLIVIVRNVSDDQLIPFCQAVFDGGIRCLEITYKSDGTADEHTANQIRLVTTHFCDRLTIGAGTVLTPHQVQLTAEAGGNFVISPDVNKEVISETVNRGLVSIPGAFTPTEIAEADRYGADFVKLFPASALGTSYIKAIKNPISHIRLLAVGGIHMKSISEYLSAGICGFGIGSNLTNRELLEKNDYAAITALSRQYVEAVGRGVAL